MSDLASLTLRERNPDVLTCIAKVQVLHPFTSYLLRKRLSLTHILPSS